MTSQVGGNLEAIETGACKLTFKGLACGHTLGGAKINIAADLRGRRTEGHGQDGPEMISQGNTVGVKGRRLEKSMTVLQIAHSMSYEIVNATTLGFGRRPGFSARERAGVLLLHPLEAEDTENDVAFYNTTIIAVAEANFGTVKEDRAFDVTFRCMLDESQSNGRLIGTFGVDNASNAPPDNAFMLTDGSDFLLTDGSHFILS